MEDWKPQPNSAFDFRASELDPQQGFVLSRIDGATTFRELMLLTGLTRDDLKQVLSLLERAGAVLPTDVLAEFSVDEDPYALLNTLDGQFPVDDLTGENTELDEQPIEEELEEGAGYPSSTARDALQPPPDDQGRIEAHESAFLVEDTPEDFALPSDAERLETAKWSGVYREKWQGVPVEARIEAARRASSDELHAFCFDQNAKVLRAILENTQVGLSHARLLAAHHVNGAGLEALAKKTQFLRDGQVQRSLMRNAQLSEALLVRILTPKALSEVHRIALSREVTERVRQQARKAFRTKFTRASSEEKVNLIVRSEGRCLVGLVGVALDGKSASLLSQRPIQSTLLVQNLVRWPSTPSPVLLHLAKQPIVLRSPPLKNLVLRHPNASSQLKRQLG